MPPNVGETILNVIRSVDADVLAITQIDGCVSNPFWWSYTDVAPRIVEDVILYVYYTSVWYTVVDAIQRNGSCYSLRITQNIRRSNKQWRWPL